jgi:hypothetical protein
MEGYDPAPESLATGDARREQVFGSITEAIRRQRPHDKFLFDHERDLHSVRLAPFQQDALFHRKPEIITQQLPFSHSLIQDSTQSWREHIEHNPNFYKWHSAETYRDEKRKRIVHPAYGHGDPSSVLVGVDHMRNLAVYETPIMTDPIPVYLEYRQ